MDWPNCSRLSNYWDLTNSEGSTSKMPGQQREIPDCRPTGKCPSWIHPVDPPPFALQEQTGHRCRSAVLAFLCLPLALPPAVIAPTRNSRQIWSVHEPWRLLPRYFHLIVATDFRTSGSLVPEMEERPIHIDSGWKWICEPP